MTAYNQISRNKLKSTLLIVGFIAFVIGLGIVLSYAYEGGIGGMILAVIISLVMALISYYAGDKVALLTNGAHGPIKLEDNPYLYRMVENLAITAGLPMPKVYLIADTSPNAFATGRDPEHASVAVTTGILEALKNEELEGVLAHELSHIKNYDIRLMTVVIICVGIVNLLAQIFLRVGGFSGHGRNRNQVGFAFALVGLILLIFSPIIAKLIQLAVSRKREFLADASGALLTRYPEGLARALEKIDSAGQPLQRANSATAHLFFANPFGSHRRWLNVFSTHPPVAERVAALRSIA
ncbi:MAG: hypothetical protein ACD_41C00344G0013 [uncultured bacterium]|nr:MAG: hypothetical protein ACD_41C00344G0013 [uncultured bacterium]HBY73895.1 zinc metalloprotease HtpX [Candidatus Kerfeldbacteria bacterium]